MRRGSLLSQPQAVLQKLASISEGNPLAPRNSRGFLFQTLSPEKDNASSDAPQKQVRGKACCAVIPVRVWMCRHPNKSIQQTVLNQKAWSNWYLASKKLLWSDFFLLDPDWLSVSEWISLSKIRTKTEYLAKGLGGCSVWQSCECDGWSPGLHAFYITTARWSHSPLLWDAIKNKLDLLLPGLISLLKRVQKQKITFVFNYDFFHILQLLA